MSKDVKQTLISLSLAGAIGYYLYTKMNKGNKMEQPQVPERNDKVQEDIELPEEQLLEETFVAEIIEPEIGEQEDIFEEEIIEVEKEETEESIPMEELPVVEEVEEMQEQPDSAHLFDDFTIDVPEIETPDLSDVLDPISSPLLDEENVTEDEKEEEVTEVEEVSLDQEKLVEDSDVELIAPPVFDEAEDEIKLEMLQSDDIELVDTGFVESLDLEQLEMSEETSVEELFEAVKEEEPPQEEVLMENVEPLHKIDQKDESAKNEFKSIMDFFNTI